MYVHNYNMHLIIKHLSIVKVTSYALNIIISNYYVTIVHYIELHGLALLVVSQFFQKLSLWKLLMGSDMYN